MAWVWFAVVTLPVGLAAFGGSSLQECQAQCLAEGNRCDYSSCNISQVCEFECTCVERCHAGSENWSFSLCSDYLKTCFEQAPIDGYGHLKCWKNTCGSYYATVKQERASGEWQGLGGWQVFGKGLPVAASNAKQFWHSAVPMVATALLATLVLLSGVVACRRRSLRASAELLDDEESGWEVE